VFTYYRVIGPIIFPFLRRSFLPRLRVAFVALSLTLFPVSFGRPSRLTLRRPQANTGDCSETSQLEALAGEYTDQNEPDTPVSFYVQDGKLVFESERNVPADLKPVSALEFSLHGAKFTLRFALDADGHGSSVVFSDTPNDPYRRTGPAVHHLFHDYQRTEVMIPMRDGVKLHTILLKPTDINTPLPFLIQRTPYGAGSLNRASFFATRPELARDGYIAVAQDIRGRYKSEGEFIMSRPMADHRDPNAVDESTDAYDTVAWLLKNVAGNNGRAGFIGTSYPGFLAMAAGIDPHPAVKAISPQAPMIDAWMGDDFFHNGAFRQSYGYDYVLRMETGKKEITPDYGRDKDGKPRDGFDFFLERGSFAEDVKQSGSKLLPTWKLFLDHPAYDSRLALARRRAQFECGRGADALRRRLLRPGRYVRPAD
jgi:hypothetical protein